MRILNKNLRHQINAAVASRKKQFPVAPSKATKRYYQGAMSIRTQFNSATSTRSNIVFPTIRSGPVPTPIAASIRKWTAGQIATSPLGSLEECSRVASFAVGEAIYRNGDPVEFWYRIVAGAARKCAFTLYGTRQIVDFLRPGDLFGYDAPHLHTFAVEAIASGTRVVRYPRVKAEQVADSEPLVAKQIRQLAFESVHRVQTRMLILGRATALEKVCSFLLEMADRFRARSDAAVTLPMSRYDIADYLAMAVETVSRAMTNLRQMDVIHLEGVRCVRICNRDALEGVIESFARDVKTRRPIAVRDHSSNPHRPLTRWEHLPPEHFTKHRSRHEPKAGGVDVVSQVSLA
jgi:CRP/FNR family nitrogen fixation transcriptional regulator